MRFLPSIMSGRPRLQGAVLWCLPLILGAWLTPCVTAMAAETQTGSVDAPKGNEVPTAASPEPAATEPASGETPEDTSGEPSAKPATPLAPGLLWHYSESAQSALLDAEPDGWPRPQRIWLETRAANGALPERFLALWQPPTGGPLRGKLLIAPCEKGVVSRPLQLKRLQSDLAASGFSSLVVALPGQTAKAVPPRPAVIQPPPQSPPDGTDKGADEVDADVTPTQALPDEKDQVFDDSANPVQTEMSTQASTPDATASEATATATDDTPAPPIDSRQQARDRLLSALAFITEQGRAPLFGLGCGLGAEQLLHALATESNSLSGWMLVNPLVTEPESLASAPWWPNMKGPVLDLLTSPTKQSATAYRRDQQTARKIAAGGKGVSPYLTREIAADSLETATETAQARAIRGFLLRYTAAP